MMIPNKPYSHRSKALLVGIALFAGSTAFANIDVDADGGASLKIDNSSTNAPTLNVGINYKGNSLIVTNAGSIIVDDAFIGSKDIGENSIIITGTGSFLRATASMAVGPVNSTENTLVIEDGASIYVGDMNTNMVGGGISIGSTNRTATLSLGSGTTATAETLLIGTQSNETGSVALSGSGTTLDLANSLLLGTAGTSNTLTVGSGTSLTVGSELLIGSTNSAGNRLTINSGGSAIILGSTTINDGTANSINVASGGHLSIIEGMDLDNTTNGFNISSGASLQLGGVLTTTSLDRNIDITLDGPDASWTTTGDMQIGNAANGNLLILQDGAAITNGAGKSLYVGNLSNNNELLVSGTNSHLKAQGTAFVGNKGDGNSLTIEDSGSADIDGGLLVGNTSGASGNKVFVRSGGQLTVQTNIVVGLSASGNQLNIEEGGTLDANGSIIIGRESGAKSNTLNVSGSNTAVSVANDLIVGSRSINNRYFQTGGTNTVAGEFIIGRTEDATGKTTIGKSDTTGNLGSVGEGAALNIQQNLTVGKQGGGSILLIHDGGAINIAGDAVIGEAASDNYIFLQPDDPESRFNVAGDLLVGKEGGNNRFAVYGGTATIDGNLYLGSSTNQHVAKNYIHIETTNAVLNVANAIYIGASNSVNTLDLVAGAKASAQDLFVGTYDGVSNNVVTVTGEGSLLSITNNLAIGSNSGSNNAVNVKEGGTLFVGNGISIGAATNDLNNRLNINSGGTLQTIDWDFAAVSSNLFLNSGSTLEVGGSLSGTNQVEGGFEIAINSGIATNNALWDSGTNALYVGHDTANNTLSVFGEGTAIAGEDLVIGFGTNSHNNAVFVYGSNSTLTALNDLIVGLNGHDNALTITDGGTVTVTGGDLEIGSSTNSSANLVSVYGSNSTLNVGNNLIVGNLGTGNSLSITNGATVNIASNAWIGLASADNWIEARGTNSSFVVGGDLYVGSTNSASTGNQLGAFDTAKIFAAGNLTLTSGELLIDFDSHVQVAGNYAQDEFSTLAVWLSTNSATTNLVVGGTASIAKDSTIAVINDGTIKDLVDEDGNTNKIGRTILAAGSLEIAGQEATTALLDTEVNFQLNALLEFDYSVTNNTIFLNNFIKRSWSDSAELEGMLVDVANEIENMAAASNTLAQAMDATFQDGMTGQEIGKAMNDYYGEKESASPTHNLINQGIGGFAGQLTVRGDNTRARAGTTPAGAAGPHSAEQELQGWLSGFNTRFDKSAADGFGAYDGSTRGFLIGVDLSVAENILVGVAGGSGSSSMDKENGASSDARTTYGAVYASVGTKDWFADTSLIFGGSSIDNTLGSVFNTTSEYDAQNMAFYVGGGKEIIGKYLIVTPQASLLANYYKQDAYDEKSTDAVARSVDSFDALYAQSSLGCSLGFYTAMGNMTLKPELRAHWLHEFNASEESLPYSLLGGTGNYTMLLQAPEEDILKIGAGLVAKMSEYLELRADLDTRWGSDYSDYTLLGSIRYQF